MSIENLDKSFIMNASDILGDTENGLTGTIITKFFNQYASKYEVTIPHPAMKKAINKKITIAENLFAFNGFEQFEIIKNLCEHETLLTNSEVKELKQNLFQRYSELSTQKITETKIVKEAKSFLSDYPNVLEVYNSGLEKCERKCYERNALDDMRLALELLLKAILKNEKSLENQLENIGSLMKSKETSPELTNTFQKILDYYSKYQNIYVKHNNLVKENEVEFIIEYTSIMMKHIIKIYKE